MTLQLPAHVEAYQPRLLPFWSVAAATTRIASLLRTMPEGGLFEVFLPALLGPGPKQARARRAAVAATLVAGLEMARSGSVTVQQDASWQPIRMA